MRIGDKVRYIHSKGEGIVRKIIDPKTVEIEIEDGFLIPVLKNEIVVVSSNEINISESRESNSNISTYNTGIWFCFVPFNDKTFSMYLINEINEDILFTVGEDNNNNYKGISSGILKPSSSFKFSDVSISDFENWPEWIFQILFFKEGNTNIKNPLVKKVRLKANTFFKNKQAVPVLGKEGHVFRIDGDNVKVDPRHIAESMFKSSPESTNSTVQKPDKEVDLHIEKLTKDFSKMSNSEMVSLQMNTFEKQLDNAIASGMHEIIFIHGTGNGVLRDQIHKTLSKNKNILFFQDAQKEKFGYGATLVKIK